MRDHRLTPANARVAATRLKGQISADQFTDGELACVNMPVVDLLKHPDGPRDRQLIWGEKVTVYERHEGWAFVEAAKDGFVGYIPATALGALIEPTHFVAVPSTHLYPEPNLKTKEVAHLSFGARLRIVSAAGSFNETVEGLFVPRQHIRPVNAHFTDPATIASLFFGTPYLWGGNSILGIDCSGLVQAALTACGIACPGDSDLQENALGTALPEDAPLKRGDLLFWKGHVAMMVDETTLLHANGHTMSVAYESAADAITRIEAAGDGPPTSRRRL